MLRSAAAAFLGLVSVFVLSLGTDQVLHSLDVYPPWGQPMYDTSLCLLVLTALPCAWLGGVLHRGRFGSSPFVYTMRRIKS